MFDQGMKKIFHIIKSVQILKIFNTKFRSSEKIFCFRFSWRVITIIIRVWWFSKLSTRIENGVGIVLVLTAEPQQSQILQRQLLPLRECGLVCIGMKLNKPIIFV